MMISVRVSLPILIASSGKSIFNNPKSKVRQTRLDGWTTIDTHLRKLGEKYGKHAREPCQEQSMTDV